jgi:hypothetical protein
MSVLAGEEGKVDIYVNNGWIRGEVDIYVRVGWRRGEGRYLCQ